MKTDWLVQCSWCYKNKVRHKYSQMCQTCYKLAQEVFNKTGSPMAIFRALKGENNESKTEVESD